MFNFPFLGYPYNYPYYRYYNRYNSNIKDTTNNTQTQNQEQNEKEKDSITNSNKISNTINSRSYSDSDQAIFEIFGIKLYLDDLIIIGLLFFLYQQNVNDEMLYMILFLLLFS